MFISTNRRGALGNKTPSEPSPRKGRHQLNRGGGDVSAFKTRPTHTGRLELPDSDFVLRSDILAPGDYSLTKAISDVKKDWLRQAKNGSIAATTVNTHSKVLTTLGNYAKAHKIRRVADLSSQVIGSWMVAVNEYTGEPVAVTTRKNRRTVASQFFATCICLGITDSTPVFAVPSVPRPLRHVRPFLPDEIDRLKEHAQRGFRAGKGPAALALLLLGASPGEVGSITCSDIDFVNRVVRAHGGGSRYRERWLPIDDDWVFEKLTERVEWLAKNRSNWLNEYVAYAPAKSTRTSFESRCAATSMTVTGILKRARLNIKGETRVASITEYVANRIFLQTGRIEAVAARLGITRLDDASVLVGYDWHTEYACTPTGLPPISQRQFGI